MAEIKFYRTKEEKKYYIDKCIDRGFHLWKIASSNRNQLNFQCTCCGTLGQATVEGTQNDTGTI